MGSATTGAAQQYFGDLRNLDETNVKTHFAAPTAKSLEDWQARRTQLRRQILVSAGLMPMPERTPLRVTRTGRKQHGAFFVDKVVFEPVPGFYVAGNLYVPVNASASHRVPGVLVPHGHWKKGRAHQTTVYSVPTLCANLAVQGYVAFAYDMIGYNDTRQLPHRFGESTSEQLWSFNLLGQQLWDSIRAVDLLESLPEVDPDRIGVTGSSGGGTQTFLLTAVDDRIKAAAPVDMVSANFQGDDACEVAPGLRVNTNNVEITAMMAPRPLLLVSSTHDWSKNTPTEEFPAVRSIYSLYGRPDLVSSVQVDAEHNFNQASREAVYTFLHEHLLPAGGVFKAGEKIQETYAFTFPNDELLFGEKPEYLTGAAGFDQLFARWREAAQHQTESLSRAELRERLQATIGVSWPERVETLQTSAQRILLTPGQGQRLPAQWLPGSEGIPTLVVHPDGSDAARRTAYVAENHASGTPMLLLDAYQTGAAEAPVAWRPGDALTFHRTDDANRVQDILTGLAWLRERSRTVRLHCTGKASAWCMLAAAVAPFPVLLDAEQLHLPASDEELKRIANVPGLQRAGGLRVARMLAEPMGDLLLTVTDNGFFH